MVWLQSWYRTYQKDPLFVINDNQPIVISEISDSSATSARKFNDLRVFAFVRRLRVLGSIGVIVKQSSDEGLRL
jgi:hypothetical protein